MKNTTYILVLDPATACYLRDTARFPNPDAGSPIAYTTFFKAQAQRFATFAEAQNACPRGWLASRVETEVTESPDPTEVRAVEVIVCWKDEPDRPIERTIALSLDCPEEPEGEADEVFYWAGELEPADLSRVFSREDSPEDWYIVKVLGERTVPTVPTPSEDAVDAFVRGYVAAALWASVPLDALPNDDASLEARGFTARSIDPDSMSAAENDCRAFVTDNWATLREVLDDSYTEHLAGSDFFLSRNGHGAGFFDRGRASCWHTLQRAAKVWGETHATIDGDRCSIQ